MKLKLNRPVTEFDFDADEHSLESNGWVRIVRCGECIHFTQGGWCDREFDWFPVDENDFCSMAEKMEVQE